MYDNFPVILIYKHEQYENDTKTPTLYHINKQPHAHLLPHTHFYHLTFIAYLLLISQPLQDKLQWLKPQTPPKIICSHYPSLVNEVAIAFISSLWF